jgi:hypothetical protein
MSTFFGDLKKKRDFSETDQPQSEQPETFFSSLKQKRNSPEFFQRNDTFQEPEESVRERIRRGYKDVAQQSAVGGASGLLGSYGNIAQLIGVNPEEGYINPGEKAQYGLEADILEKMKQPGYKPSISDIYALSDEDITPRFSRLPTSSTISQTIEELGGPGEATTPEGRIARRSSEIYGGGLSMGVGGIVPALVGGTAGEAAQSLGAGPVGQTVAEIIGILASQGRNAGSALTSRIPEVESRIQSLRKLGYSDRDILQAVNAQKATSNRVKSAKATSASEKGFNEALAKSEGLFEETLERLFPGIEKGTEHLHQVASDAYGQVARDAKNVRISNPARFQKTIDNVQQRLQNTLGNNPEAQPFLKRLEEASIAASARPNADTYINFYKELNKLGKWMNPKEKEILITHVKNGIKSSFRNSGPEGKYISEQFERVNKGIQRAYQAEDVMDLLNRGMTQEGRDWKKTLKLFDKQTTWDTLETGLGKQQAKNIHQIAKVGKDVGDFQKALGSKAGKKLIEKGGVGIGALGVLWSLWTHNPKYATLALGTKVAATGAKSAYQRLQTRLLTDPKFQNITLRTMEAVKNDHPRALIRALQDFEKYSEDEGINLIQ